MKGIILAGGSGSRLYPMTKVVSKQLQAVYDKPMIYFPISLLLMCGIDEIIIITTKEDQKGFQQLLGDGHNLNLKFEYIVQDRPEGIAQAYLLAEEFLGGEDSLLILGDNLFYGDYSFFRKSLEDHMKRKNNQRAKIFAYPVNDPERYGVVEFEKNSLQVKNIEEKPKNPRSNYAIPGLYLLDGTAGERVRNQKKSARGELEITDLLQTYLDEDLLGVSIMSRGMAWLDVGTPLSLLEAGTYISIIEQRQGLKVACIEEISYRMGNISLEKLESILEKMPNGSYRDYLLMIVKEEKDKILDRDLLSA